MKKIIFIIVLTLITFSFQETKICPPKGDRSDLKSQKSDLLKNRSKISKTIKKIVIDSILAPGNDTIRFSEKNYVSVIGYIYNVKWGGAETCNCHSTDKSQLDIHIELVKDLNNADNEKSMIVEITRYSRGSLTYESIRKLKGKKVEVKGWMFFDDEHQHNAVNTRPNGTNLWRATCWEIHPCFSIKEIN